MEHQRPVDAPQLPQQLDCGLGVAHARDVVLRSGSCLQGDVRLVLRAHQKKPCAFSEYETSMFLVC